MKRRKFSRAIVWGLGLLFLLGLGVFWITGKWREHQERARVESIAAHSVRVRSIDPNDDDFSDLEPLVGIIGQSRFVLMGETTHDDGGTIAARTRLIRFLHRKLDFDVIAVEDSYVSVGELSESLNSEDAYRRFAADHPRQVTLAKQRALVDFVHATRMGGDRPVALMGCSVYYFLDTELMSRVQTFMAHMPTPVFSDPEAMRFASILASILGADITTGQLKFGRLTREDFREFDALAGRLTTAIAEHRTALVQATSAAEVAYFEGLAGSLSAFVASATMSEPHDADRDREQLDRRDKGMADLILHASRELYPHRKMVILAANSHLLRTAGDFRPMRGITSMGERLHREHASQIYTIVFEAYQGSSGEGAHVLPMPPASPRTMAYLFHQIGDEFRFLDLHNLPANHWLRRDHIGIRATSPRPDGDSTIWPNVADGIFYLDQQRSVPDHSDDVKEEKQ